MKSKMWCFNKTLFKKDLTRFCPVWLIYTVILLLTGIQSHNPYSGWEYQLCYFSNGIWEMATLHLAYALIVASCLFGDLTKNRMSHSIHALPLRREQIFMTHFFAGLLFSLVPNTVFVLIQCIRLPEWSFLFFAWLGGATIEYLFFFCLGVVCCICTGSRFAAVVVYAFLNFFSMIVFWFYDLFYAPLLPGIQVLEAGFNRFSPMVQIVSQHNMIQMDYYNDPISFLGFGPGWGYLWILAGLSLVLLGLGIWLYRKRHLERAGDFFCFNAFLPVFYTLFTLFIAGAFSLFDGTIPVIAGFFVGGICVEMLMRRTVSIFDRRFFKKFALVGGLFLLSLLLTFLDPLGITRWVPEPEQVASVRISNNYYYNPEYGVRRTYSSDSEDAIEEIIQIHKLVLENTEDFGVDFRPIHITYTLKNGRTAVRRYFYETGSDAAKKVEKFTRLPEFLMTYEDWDEYLASVETVYVDNHEYSRDFSGELARELVTAIREDAKEGLVDLESSAEYYVNIQTENDGCYLPISKKCTRTMKWIREHLSKEL